MIKAIYGLIKAINRLTQELKKSNSIEEKYICDYFPDYADPNIYEDLGIKPPFRKTGRLTEQEYRELELVEGEEIEF